MMSVLGEHRIRSKLMRLDEYRMLPISAQRNLLRMICNGEIVQNDISILSAIEEAKTHAREEA